MLTRSSGSIRISAACDAEEGCLSNIDVLGLSVPWRVARPYRGPPDEPSEVGVKSDILLLATLLASYERTCSAES